MGLFKSEEEKAQEEAERLRAEQEYQEKLRQAEEAKLHKQWLTSPIGLARTAMDAGDRFCEVQLAVGRQVREAMFGARDYDAKEETLSSAQVLGEIEEMGWRLEHVGYVFRMTGQSSSEKVFLSGQETAVSGDTIGIYLFRNATGLTPSASTDPIL